MPIRPPHYGLGEPPIRSDVYGILPDPRIVTFSRDGRERPHITIDGRELEQKYVLHSPDGLEFGYPGSGPADCALNILALVVSPREAYRLHQSFKFDVFLKIPRSGGTLQLELVREWVRQKYEEEANDPLFQAQEKAQREAAGVGDDEDPLGSRDDDTPSITPELIRPCEDRNCKECRTGESEEKNFLENVQRLLCRDLEGDEEKILARRYYETGYGPEYAAKLIAETAAGIVGERSPNRTNYGSW